jgi:hypothetical protein
MLVLIYSAELNQELKLFLFITRGHVDTEATEISATEVREEEYLKQAIPR